MPAAPKWWRAPRPGARYCIRDRADENATARYARTKGSAKAVFAAVPEAVVFALRSFLVDDALFNKLRQWPAWRRLPLVGGG
jgi:hypothetical protein